MSSAWFYLAAKFAWLFPQIIIKNKLTHCLFPSFSLSHTHSTPSPFLSSIFLISILQTSLPSTPVFLPQVFDMGVYQEKIRAYGILPGHSNVAGIRDIILGECKAYVFLDKDFGDMHTLVKSCRRLDEENACRLFRQVARAVAHCHQNGIVLGDLKLRKFVFADEKR